MSGKKVSIKKISSLVLCLMAIILIFSGIFQGDGKKIVGKWETDPGKKDARVYEFYDDNTGVDYRNLTNGETYNAESFGYKLTGDTVTIDYGLVSRVYSYEISGKQLIMDNKTYTKTGSFNGLGWIKYIIAIAMLVLAKYLYEEKLIMPKVKEKAKAEAYKKESPGDINEMFGDIFGGVNTKKKAEEHIKTEVPLDEIYERRIKSTMRTTSSDVTSSKTSDNNGFHSAGDL